MDMQFTLIMGCLVVENQKIDEFIIQWTEKGISQSQILECRHQWMNSTSFLTGRMQGLKKVGESSLIIEPLAQ